MVFKVDIQEIISRGRFVFAGVQKRLEVFKLVDGKRSAKDISRKTGRSLSSVLRDIKMMNDYELIKEKTSNEGTVLKRHDSRIFEKAPLAKHIPISYFFGIEKMSKTGAKLKDKTTKGKDYGVRPLSVPSPHEILDICRYGEDQIYEFKDPRVQMSKISKEIAAFLHTKNGGILFYGIGDDGSIIGSDLTRQKFDQSLQNSVKNTISPQPYIEIKESEVLGHKIILIIIPPWDRKSLYQYNDGRFYIRRGTNVFVVSPSDMKRLSNGKIIV